MKALVYQGPEKKYNQIERTQAKNVRTPHADTCLYKLPQGIDYDAIVILSDILPTGFNVVFLI